jgi:hypothetical protein
MISKKSPMFFLVALIILLIEIEGAAASTEVFVSANPLWTDTEITVKQGEDISVDYVSGQWTTGINGYVGPNGDGDMNDNHDLFLAYPTACHGQLIAFIGPISTDPYQGHWGDITFFPQQAGNGYWAIGSSAVFTADRDGILWLGINDDSTTYATGDNGGVLTVITKGGNHRRISVPEFPSIAVPMAAILGLILITKRRKVNDK